MIAVDSNKVTRRQVLLRTGALGAALTIPGALAACGESSSNAVSTGASGRTTEAEIDQLTWGINNQPPRALDIAQDWTIPSQVATASSLEPLVYNDTNLKLRPLLARGFSQPDLTHYVFDLRPGIKFWDGSPLTVDDVVFSINRHTDPKVASLIGFFFEKVASVEAKGDDRIVITLSKPEPALPQILTIIPIFSKKFAERVGDDLGKPGPNVTVMGTGPYEVVGFTSESGVELQRNESYWGGKPKVKRASIKYFDETETALLAARSGSIDGCFGFGLSEAQTWSNVPGLDTQFVKADGLNVTFLSFDLESDPWSDIHVRRALAHCCDTAGYTKAFLGGEATSAEAVVPPAQWSNLASRAEVEEMYAEIPQYEFSIAKAKAELAKSAYPDGFSASLSYPNTYPMIGRAMVSLSQSLKKIGINLKVSSLPESQWIATIYEHKDLGIQPLTFIPDYNDPVNYMLTLYPSENAVENAFNTANFKNPVVDRLLREQATAKDDEERAQMLGEVLKISGEELPYLPLWWEGPTMAISDKYAFNGFTALYYYQPWLDYVGVRA